MRSCTRLFAALAIVLASPASAGTVMRFEERGVDGSSPTTGTAWIDKDRLKVETGKDSVVFREDKLVLWHWRAGEKTYVEMTKAHVDAVASAMAEMQKQMANMSPEERAMMQQVMGSRMGAMSAHATAAAKPVPASLAFKPLGRSQEINSWKCAGYSAHRGEEPAGEYWAASWDQFGLTASDFTVFERLATFIAEVVGPLGSSMDSTYAQPFGEAGLPGVPVRVTTPGPNGARVHEIKTLAHEDLPASTFELPAGLTKQEMGAPGKR